MRLILAMAMGLLAAGAAKAQTPDTALPPPEPVALAQPVVEAVSAEPLLGAWLVDRSSTPAQALGGRYSVDFVVTGVDDDRITGSFYGSPIEQGRINRSWGAVRFAFVTRDGGGGVYHHSGELVDGRLIRGLSHGIDRDFLAVWTAVPGRLADQP